MGYPRVLAVTHPKPYPVSPDPGNPGTFSPRPGDTRPARPHPAEPRSKPVAPERREPDVAAPA